VTSFVVTGSATRNLGRHVADQSVEIACQTPDRFVRMVSYNAVFGGPGDIRMILTTRDGFNATSVIRERTTSGDLPAPPDLPPLGPPPTPEEREAHKRAAVLAQRGAFARLALVLFAASHSVIAGFSGGRRLAEREGGGGSGTGRRRHPPARRFDVAPASHVVWAKPIVLARQSGSWQCRGQRRVPAGGATGGMPPFAGMPPVPPPPPPAQDDLGSPGHGPARSSPAGDPTVGLPLVDLLAVMTSTACGQLNSLC
jgi:hypothetical protein